MIAILIFCLIVYLVGFIAALIVTMTLELELDLDDIPLQSRLKDALGSWVEVIVIITILNLHSKGMLNLKHFRR